MTFKSIKKGVDYVANSLADTYVSAKRALFLPVMAGILASCTFPGDKVNVYVEQAGNNNKAIVELYPGCNKSNHVYFVGIPVSHSDACMTKVITPPTTPPYVPPNNNNNNNNNNSSNTAPANDNLGLRVDELTKQLDSIQNNCPPRTRSHDIDSRTLDLELHRLNKRYKK